MTAERTPGCDALRASNAALGPRSDTVRIEFQGRPIEARRGESLLAALVAAGELRLRETQRGEYRGPFCGMGVCQECLVEVDGAPAERACLTTVERSVTVRRQGNRIAAAAARSGADAPPRDAPLLRPQIAVIGGGPGGMAAASAAARAGAQVLLIDERPKSGGQFYKQPLSAPDLRLADYDDPQFRAGRERIAELERSGAAILRGARVAGVYEPLDLVVTAGAETILVRPQILILATGAYETCYPFAGWTLPGVMTTGAAQTLLRSYRVLPGRRILVAGNGPLNFQVAAELAGAGARSVTLAEAAPAPGPRSAGTALSMLRSAPALTLMGMRYLRSLRRRGVPLRYAHRVAGAAALEGGGLRVRLQNLSGGTAEPGMVETEVDALCLGYGFSPNNELLRALGCRQQMNTASGTLETLRDRDCRTSRDDVFAVGDCSRLRGAPMAAEEGLLAACAALGALGIALAPALRRASARARSRRPRHERFQQALWRLFEPAGDLPGAIDDNTVICRCEELTRAALQQAVDQHQPASMGSLKRLTRAGMGRCQGRYCATCIARLFGLQQGSDPGEADLWAPRPPARPVRVADLARLRFPDDGP